MKTPRVLCMLALTATACGGEGGTFEPPPAHDSAVPPPVYEPGDIEPGAITGTPGDVSCTPTPGIEYLMLEDYEFGAASGWYASADICTPCQDIVNAQDALPATAPQAQRDALAAQLSACTPACLDTQRSPRPGFIENPPSAALLDRPRCGSRFAMYIDSGPLLDWGGNMGITFNPPRDMLDEHIDGISFWARRSPTSRSNVRLEVGERHTDPNYTGGPNGGPICNPNTTDDNSEEGCDRFGSFVVLREEWQQYFVPFAEMRQGGWGRRAEEFDLRGVMAFSIYYAQGSWQFWIDDLAFYRQAR